MNRDVYAGRLWDKKKRINDVLVTFLSTNFLKFNFKTKIEKKTRQLKMVISLCLDHHVNHYL